MWPTMTFLLLGCSLVMSSGGSYVDELQHKISSANECIQRLVDCSATYSPLAVNEIDGSFFQDPVDLERACRKNTFYINCVERTKRYCEQQNIGEVETAMIKNRLWIKDLCAANSKWKKLYVMHSECVIRESFTYRKECTLHQKPVDPRYIGLEDLCRYFKGIVDCTAYVVKRECGDQASELFRRISMMKGNREYLCPDSKRPESPQLQAAKQMLRNVRSLMSNMSSIVKATLSEEDAAYVLQELDPQEVERIKKLFRSKSGIQYGESPLFEMQDLVDEGHEEDEFPSRDEYSIQIIEVHTAKRIKDTIGVDYVKSQQEEKIENLEKSYVVDWSSQLNQNYKSEDVDYPGDIVHLVQKAEVDYPEGLELDASVHHNSRDPEYWNDLTPHHKPETYDPTDSVDSYYSEPHSHQKDVADESSPQLSDDVKSEDIEVYAELKDSDQVFILEDGIDGDLSCKRLYHRLPEDPAFESNASFHVYKIQNHGKTHLGSGQTMVKWKTMSDTPLDDLFCSWLDPGASRTLFKCAIKLTELKHKTEELREPRPHPILLALYASNAADGFPMQLTEVATFCVENYKPSEEEPLSNSKLREYLHCRKDGKEMEIADSLEVDGVKKCQLEDCDESHLKHSIQKRVLEVLQDESSDDALDRNLSVFKEQLPEQIKDVKEKFGSLLDRKLSDPFKMYPSLSEVAAGEGDDSFHETSCPPKMNDCKIGNFLTGCPPEIVDALKDSNTDGKIPTTVSTTLKPGVYIDVTSLESTNSLKFGKENVNYIVVGNRPTKSTLAASDHFVPEPISFGFLDAEQFIKNGIDSIRADQAAESVQE